MHTLVNYVINMLAILLMVQHAKITNAISKIAQRKEHMMDNYFAPNINAELTNAVSKYFKLAIIFAKNISAYCLSVHSKRYQKKHIVLRSTNAPIAIPKLCTLKQTCANFINAITNFATIQNWKIDRLVFTTYASCRCVTILGHKKVNSVKSTHAENVENLRKMKIMHAVSSINARNASCTSYFRLCYLWYFFLAVSIGSKNYFKLA